MSVATIILVVVILLLLIGVPVGFYLYVSQPWVQPPPTPSGGCSAGSLADGYYYGEKSLIGQTAGIEVQVDGDQFTICVVSPVQLTCKDNTYSINSDCTIDYALSDCAKTQLDDNNISIDAMQLTEDGGIYLSATYQGIITLNFTLMPTDSSQCSTAANSS